MKHIFKIVIGVLFSIGIFTFCNEDDSIVKSEKYSFDDFKILGQKHNEGLEQVLNDIKEFKKINNNILLKRKDIDNVFIANSIEKFAKSDSDFNLHSSNLRSNSIRMTQKFYPDNNLQYKNDDADFAAILANSDLTDVQKVYISKILTVNSENGLEFENKILKIVNDFESDVSYDEKIILYLASATALYSFQYWSENIDEWEEVLNSNDSSSNSTKSWSWKSFWKTDVEGGVGGAIGGALTGGTVSFGTLAIPAAIVGGVGGAIGTSAGNAITQWLF